MKTVKYENLNAYTVKMSALKAHQQLFRMYRKYKVMNILFYAFLLFVFRNYYRSQ